MIKEDLWQIVLADLQLSLSKAIFSTWFKNTSIVSCEDNRVVVGVPNTFTKEWLQNKYNKHILKVLREADPSIRVVEYVVARPSAQASKLRLPSQEPRKHILEPSLASNEETSLFKDVFIDRETGLNSRYAFENFVIGSFNEIAHAAAQVVIKNPGTVYNPLFVYGGVGVGKTHLLQATGNALCVTGQQLKVRYLSSEKFTEEVVSGIRNRTIDEMKEHYRQLDVLIIDDVQFVAGKDKTQEELFHVFNTLYQRNKQIIFSSDRPPKAIPAIEERLRSRFEGGMIADIGIPDFETRVAILRTKNQERGMALSDEVLAFIATHVQKNIRELEGALNRVIAHTKTSPIPLENQDLQRILKSVVTTPRKIVSPKKIIEIVAEFYDIATKELTSTKRKKEIVRPRQISMYLLREELQNSYPFIGEFFGGKDHTTVIHACDKIIKEMEEKESFREEIMLIRQRLYNT